MKDKYALLTGKFQGRNDEKVRGKKMHEGRKMNKMIQKGGCSQ